MNNLNVLRSCLSICYCWGSRDSGSITGWDAIYVLTSGEKKVLRSSAEVKFAISQWKYSSATKSSPALTILSTIRCPKIAIISRYSDSAIHFRTIVKSAQCLFITRADCKGHHHSIIKSKENKRPGFRIMGAVIVKLHLTSIWHDFTLFLVTVSFLAVWAPPGSHRHR